MGERYNAIQQQREEIITIVKDQLNLAGNQQTRNLAETHPQDQDLFFQWNQSRIQGKIIPHPTAQAIPAAQLLAFIKTF